MTKIRMEQHFAADTVWEPLYRMETAVEPYERELFQSEPLRRLKQLYHYGAGALVSPVTHSRFEHTVGVWALTKRFFPGWKELHAAAIVHDIGHLPFSHTVEMALGKNHHHLTEQAIASAPISTILTRHGFSAEAIIDLLNRDTPLTHRTEGLGIDHFDSFMRDTHMLGLTREPAYELVNRIRFDGNWIEADEDTALSLLHAVADDNCTFLDPYFLAVDEVLSQAALTHTQAEPELRSRIERMTDAELLEVLGNSPLEPVRSFVRVLVKEPHLILPCKAEDRGAMRTEIRKVYKKQPRVQGQWLSDRSAAARERLAELDRLAGSFYFTIGREA
ncbi:HD domain-containing protein [Paenibacillus turpanensis]|uniref:HD domain-containing protein n=1 Tax=Paenibacillus turpanensis TaxID=2689078 RepID=UPI00140C30A2|nr:HD domain-containing protein [Paenibacillus turpanensis]